MRSSILSGSALLAASALAAPLEARQSNIDTTVLQFALTLEHLEDVFYMQALQNFTQQDFDEAGYSSEYYQNLKYIAYDEQEHVRFLSTALQAAGVTPNQRCTYNFPYSDVKSFITLSSVLESVGTAAYLGAAPLITNKQYLTAAGSILATEAKHTSYQRANIGEVPFAPPFHTPLDPMPVFTLASMFIVSCPDSNMALPFSTYPTLSYTGPIATNEHSSANEGHHGGHDDDHSLDVKLLGPHVKIGGGWRNGPWNGEHNHWGKNWQSNSNGMAPPSAGDKVTFSVMQDSIPQGSYLTFVSGLMVISQPANVGNNGKTISATVPQGAEGQTYVFVTKSNVTSVDPSSVLYGPAILEVNPDPPALDYTPA